MKELVRLTESDLHTIISNTVMSILREEENFNSDNYSDEAINNTQYDIQSMIADMQEAIDNGDYEEMSVVDNEVQDVIIFGKQFDYCCDATISPDFDNYHEYSMDPDDRIEITQIDIYNKDGEEVVDMDTTPLEPYFEKFINQAIIDGDIELDRPEYEEPEYDEDL